MSEVVATKKPRAPRKPKAQTQGTQKTQVKEKKPRAPRKSKAQTQGTQKKEKKPRAPRKPKAQTQVKEKKPRAPRKPKAQKDVKLSAKEKQLADLAAIKAFQIKNAERMVKVEEAWIEDTADLRRESIEKLREMVLERRLKVIRNICKDPFDGKIGFGLYIKQGVLDRDRFIRRFKLEADAHLSDSKLQDIVIQKRMLEHAKLCSVKTIPDLIKHEGDLTTLSKEHLIEYIKPIPMFDESD